MLRDRCEHALALRVRGQVAALLEVVVAATGEADGSS